MRSFFSQKFDVLLLDDCQEDRELYKRHMTSMAGVEFCVSEADSVLNAKEQANSQHFDCYVVDYNLPDATGLDFVRHITEQKGEQSKDAAIMVVTGQGSEEIAADAFKLGVHEYLTKKSVSEGFFARPLLSAIEKAQLTAQLRIFRDKLERSNRDLSEFTHTAAHDLKSPLRRISSYCEILQEDASERLNDDEKGILQRMMINARRMQNLIDSLLSYSLIEYDEEQRQEVSLHELVQDVLAEFQPHIDDVGGSILIKSDLPKLCIYPTRLRQLLANLISNAIKYRSEKRSLKVVIDSKVDGEFTVISVRDNGQGVDPSKKEEIFKDFKRLHSSEDVEGTGLGLSICKKIAQRHGGDIWVESKPSYGSEFYVSIKHT